MELARTHLPLHRALVACSCDFGEPRPIESTGPGVRRCVRILTAATNSNAANAQLAFGDGDPKRGTILLPRLQ